MTVMITITNTETKDGEISIYAKHANKIGGMPLIRTLGPGESITLPVYSDLEYNIQEGVWDNGR